MGKLYTPDEAARHLGVSVRMLGYLRRTGRIQGSKLANNITVYTEEQLASADLTRRKPGPKTQQGEDKEDKSESEAEPVDA